MIRPRSCQGPCPATISALLATSILAGLVLAAWGVASATAAGKGMWSPNQDWRQGGHEKKYAAHMILQPGDGDPYLARILWFRNDEDGQFLGGQWGWTPGNDGCSAYPTSNFTSISVPSSGMDLFCAGNTMTGNSIAVFGGTSPITGAFGENKSRLFSAGTGTASGTWSAPDTMQQWRWYPTSIPLRDGRIAVLSGQMHRSHRMFGGYRDDVVPSSPTGHLVQRQQPVPFGSWDPAVFPLTSSSSGWPAPRYAHTMQQMRSVSGFSGDVLFGGRDSADKAHKDVWRLYSHPNHEGASPQFIWQELSPSGGETFLERSDHSAIQTPHSGRPMVIFGGLDDDESPLNDVWRLFLDGPTYKWQQIDATGTPPPARYGHSAIYDETVHATSGDTMRRMIVFGGAETAGSAPTDPRVWELRFHATDPTSATWYQMSVVDLQAISPSPRPAPRFWHSMTADPRPHSQGTISNAHVALMFGGKRDSTAYSDSLWGLWLLRDGTVGWQLRATGSTGVAPTGRARHSATFDFETGQAPFGRLYVFGGETSSGPADSYVYMVDTWRNFQHSSPDSTWKQWQDRGFSLSGHSVVQDNGNEFARIPEVYDPDASGYKWTALTSAPQMQLNYPPSFMVPGATNDSCRVISLNNDTLQTYYLNIPKNGQPGAWQKLANGSAAFAVKTGVQYRPGKIMVAGGDSSHAPSKYVSTSGTTLTLDTSNLSNAWVVSDTMARRTHHNLVLMPTGQVLVVGGNNIFNNVVDGPVKRPQIWTPNLTQGGGTWTSYAGADSLAEQPTARTDHSTAILLPDGRVLSAGGETPADKYVANLYCPPYLFKADGTTLAARPSLTGTTSSITWGQTFDVCVEDTALIRRACLIRPGATTHSVDMNQLFVPVTILSAKANPGRLFLQAPASPDSAPPGYYLLFLLGSTDGDTIPSIARWVRINSAAPPAPDELSITADLITCDAIGPIRWAAPGDNGCASRAVDYEIRYSLSPINSGNFNSATPLSGVPDPATGGTSQTAGSVTGLSPATLVYFAGRTRSSAMVWSPLAYAELGTLSSCGGGGYGTSAGRARDEGIGRRLPAKGPANAGEPAGSGGSASRSTLHALAEQSSLSGVSTRRLVGEFSNGASLRWRLHYLDFAEDAARLAASARRLVLEEPAPNGDWEIRDSSIVSGGLAGVRSLHRSGRLIFPSGTTVDALESTPRRFTLDRADHSRLGEIPASDSTTVELDLAPGDTLDLAFRPSTSAGEGEDCVFLIRLPGAVSTTAARRPGGRPVPETPPSDPPQSGALPTAFALHLARPNPFSGKTTLSFDLPTATRVRIELFDVQGRRVAKLLDQPMVAGRHAASWNGRLDRGGIAEAGVYLCRMTADAFVAERSVALLP